MTIDEVQESPYTLRLNVALGRVELLALLTPRRVAPGAPKFYRVPARFVVRFALRLVEKHVPYHC